VKKTTSVALKIGDWTYHPQTLVVRFREGTRLGEEVDLEKKCRTYVETLHLIWEVEKKSWATGEVIVDLIRILDVLLHPQAALGLSGERGLLPGGNELRKLIAKNIRRWKQSATPKVDFPARA